MCYIIHTEQIDQNMKFVFKSGEQYLHWNKVPMDDMVLSCNILTTSLSNIFNQSKDEDFRQEIMDLLGIDKSNIFKQTVGCMLLQQINQNYDPSFMEDSNEYPEVSKQNIEPDECFGETNEITDLEYNRHRNTSAMCNENLNATMECNHGLNNDLECNKNSNKIRVHSRDLNLINSSESNDNAFRETINCNEDSEDMFNYNEDSNSAIKDVNEIIVGI